MVWGWVVHTRSLTRKHAVSCSSGWRLRHYTVCDNKLVRIFRKILLPQISDLLNLSFDILTAVLLNINFFSDVMLWPCVNNFTTFRRDVFPLFLEPISWRKISNAWPWSCRCYDYSKRTEFHNDIAYSTRRLKRRRSKWRILLHLLITQ